MPVNTESVVAVIGAGPAGIAAAVQLCRSGIDTVVFEKDRPGGLVRSAGLVENYPGFPGGIEGPELACLFERHLLSSGASVIAEEVVSIDRTGGSFEIKTEKERYRAGFVVIAAGTVPLKPEEIEVSRTAEPLVFTEIGPLLDLEGKQVAVIGSGDAAFDYALNLSKKNDILIIMRSSEPKCLPLLLERAGKEERIKIVKEFDCGKVEKTGSGQLSIRRKEGNEDEAVVADRLLFAVGREPADGFFSPGISENIDLLSGDGLLYLVGDLKNGIYRQTAIAVGDGIRAAMSIEKVTGRL